MHAVLKPEDEDEVTDFALVVIAVLRRTLLEPDICTDVGDPTSGSNTCKIGATPRLS